MNFETNTMPAISTAHLDLEAKGFLQECSSNLSIIVAAYEYGYFIWIGEAPEALPACLSRIGEWVRSHKELAADMGLGWVRIDRDCDRVDGLPIYDDLGAEIEDADLDADLETCPKCLVQLEADRSGPCDDCNSPNA